MRKRGFPRTPPKLTPKKAQRRFRAYSKNIQRLVKEGTAPAAPRSVGRLLYNRGKLDRPPPGRWVDSDTSAENSSMTNCPPRTKPKNNSKLG